MTAREDAISRVSRLGAITVKPVVSAQDVGTIVDTYRLVDTAGRSPSAVDWDPTYDTNAALAEVYAQKAAAVAADFDFTADDASFSKGDVLANLLKMEARYRGLAVTTGTGLSQSGASTIQVGGTNSGLVNPLDAIASQVIP